MRHCPGCAAEFHGRTQEIERLVHEYRPTTPRFDDIFSLVDDARDWYATHPAVTR